MSDLTPNYYVLLGFVGFWGLVAVGTIATILHLWMKERRLAARRPVAPHRRPK